MYLLLILVSLSSQATSRPLLKVISCILEFDIYRAVLKNKRLFSLWYLSLVIEWHICRLTFMQRTASAKVLWLHFSNSTRARFFDFFSSPPWWKPMSFPLSLSKWESSRVWSFFFLRTSSSCSSIGTFLLWFQKIDTADDNIKAKPTESRIVSLLALSSLCSSR